MRNLLSIGAALAALLMLPAAVLNQTVGYDNATGRLCFFDRGTSPQCVPVGIIDSVNHIFTARGEVDAALMPGADMGAKINAAIAALPGGRGTVDARALQGSQTWSTAVTLANVRLLLGSVNANMSAVLTVGDYGSIECVPSGHGIGNTGTGPSLLKMANGANLTSIVNVTGGAVAIDGCWIDGNKSNNASAGPNLRIGSSHWLVRGVTSQNSASDGVYVVSSGTTQEACCGTLEATTSILNNGDGFRCLGTADVKFLGSQAELNSGTAGVELDGCGAWRFTNYDIGGNQIGIYIHGNPWSSGVSNGSPANVIGAGQFGNQGEQDVKIDASSSSPNTVAGGSFANHIVGAYFWPSSSRTASTYPVIDIVEGASTGGNLISGVTIYSPLDDHKPTSAVKISGSTGNDVVVGVNAIGYFSGIVFDVPSGTSLASACVNGTCTNKGQIFSGKTTFTGTDSYAAVFSTAGVGAGDSYPLLMSNPSPADYATVTSVFSVGASNSVPVGRVDYQRLASNPGSTSYRWTYDSAGTRVLAGIEGGNPPSISGCSVGSVIGQANSGTAALGATCTAGTVTLTFAVAAAHGWACPALVNRTAATQHPQVGGTTTTATFSVTGSSGDTIGFGPCSPY